MTSQYAWFTLTKTEADGNTESLVFLSSADDNKSAHQMAQSLLDRIRQEHIDESGNETIQLTLAETPDAEISEETRNNTIQNIKNRIADHLHRTDHQIQALVQYKATTIEDFKSVMAFTTGKDISEIEDPEISHEHCH